MTNKVNFEQISQYMTAFDTDLIDIARRTEIINPDGTSGETTLDEPLYVNVPCHIAFITADNPNKDTVDTKPIITGLRINCELSVDLQNGDYITAKKMANDGVTILETYSGIIGYPAVSQSRKSAIMQMRTDL